MKKIILAGFFILVTSLFILGVRTVLAHTGANADHARCNNGQCLVQGPVNPHPDACSSNADCPGSNPTPTPTPGSSCRHEGGQCGTLNSCCSGEGLVCQNNVCVQDTTCRHAGGQCGALNACCPGEGLICSGNTCVVDSTCRGLGDQCGSLNACCSPYVCENSTCVSSGSGSGYRTCGNYDADSCLEWSNSPVACPVGQTCSSGSCGGGGGSTPIPTATPPGCIPNIPNDTTVNGSFITASVTATPKSGDPPFSPSQVTIQSTDTYPWALSWAHLYEIWWKCSEDQGSCGTADLSGTMTGCSGNSSSRGCTMNITPPANLYTDLSTIYGIRFRVTTQCTGACGGRQATRITYVATSCVSGETPTPTPTGGATGGWIQLRDGSFAGLSAVNNVIPTTVPVANRYFIANTTPNGGNVFDPGEAVSPGTLDLGGAPVSTKGWIRAGSAFIPSTSVTSYLSYIRARKGVTEPITTYAQSTNGLFEVQSNSSTSTIANNTNFPSTAKRVFVLDGDLTINVNGQFGPAPTSSGRYAFLITGNLTIDPDVDILNGIYIVQGVVNTGANNTPLTVNGNLIVQGALANERNVTRETDPSLIINFNPNYYIDLLPYLSLSTYDWRQLQ